MNLKVSERDLKLIFLVLMIAIVAGAWIGHSKLVETNEKTEMEVAALQEKYNDLKVKYNDRDRYEKDTAKLLKVYTGIMDRYGNGLDQEHIIMLLKAAEIETGVWIKSANLAGVSSIYTFGNVTSTNPSRPGEKVYVSDNIGVNSVLTVNYEGTYDQMKDFINFINTHDSKNLIGNMTFAYSDANELVTGSLQLTTYGIAGSEREYQELVLKSVAVGTENIFDSETFVDNTVEGDYGQKIMTDYDLFLMLHSEDTDVDSVAIGQKDDIDGSKTVTANSNVQEDVSIRITGTGGNYKISYKIGNTTYPEDGYAEGTEFVCGDTLDLLVISSGRLDDNDRAGAKLLVINNSDLVLNYKVVNDDTEKPRFNLGKVTGQVVGY